MILTIIIPVNKTEFLTHDIKAIIRNINDCGYPLGMIEVVFLVPTKDNIGIRSFPNGPPPLIKISYCYDYVQGYTRSIEKALGRLIIFADIKTKFPVGRINSIVKSFEQKKDLSMIIESNFLVMCASKISSTLPNDLFCIKTHLIMEALINKFVMIGPWGKLNKKEALRFVYKMDQIKLKDKIKILRSI